MTDSRTDAGESTGPPDSRAHWDLIYREKDEGRMSWTEHEPGPSLELLLEDPGLPDGARILDVGGGTSRLVDHLLDRGYRPGVLDISPLALDRTRARLAGRAGEVEWLHGSILEYRATEPWNAWHDRAVFHFLVEPDDRERYLRSLRSSLARGGVMVVATFGPDGPDRCSGLPVRRYDVEELPAVLGDGFELECTRLHEHRTPWGEPQQLLYARFRRR